MGILVVGAALVAGAGFVNSNETTGSVAAPQIKSKKRKTSSTATGADLRCPEARRAVSYYRNAYAAHRAVQELPGPVAFVRYDCPSTRRRAIEWRDRATIERYAAAAWIRDEYHWWIWMPRGSKEYRVASCETGYGRDPNWHHDSGTYVSAFGIYRAGYANDAARVGDLGWDETIRRYGRVPTPRA